MITGKTTDGFAFALDDNAMDNMELVDALADAANDDPLAIARVCRLALGKDLQKKLYDHLRTPNGRVPIEAVSRNVSEIFAAFGKKGKN